MDLSNLNIEPNVLLILLGALFVLLGASGKIFIEKFSVALASVSSRGLIAFLGILMLTFGMIGPENIFSHFQNDTEVRHTTESIITDQEKPWFSNIAGTYKGKATSSGVDYPVQTTFIVEAQGKLSGTYVIEEPDKLIGGKLVKARILGVGSIEFDWQDDWGIGKLVVHFSDDLTSFSGNWGNEQEVSLEQKWNGSRSQ